MKKLLFLLTLIPSMLFAADIACPEHLFHIAKSDNANVLYYDIKMKNGVIYDYDPVKIYWIMYAKKGGTENMTLTERPQFGINVKTIEKGKKYTVNFKNKQLSKKDVTLELMDNGCVSATTVISDTQANLTDVFINISPDSGILPDVMSLDVNGTDFEGGKVTEKIMAK